MALFRNDVNPIPSKPAPRTPTQSLSGSANDSQTGSANDSQPGSARDTDSSDKFETSGKSSESRLIVGPNIKLKGVEIEDCDTLVVEGYVEASMDSRVIEISETGVYKGTVEIDTAIVKGRFEGNLTARERLIVHTTGDVSGKIRYGRLAIDEGGRVHGDLDEISGASKGAHSAGKPDTEKDKDGKDTPGASPLGSEAAE
jgi:cytoskeletal protein CcmA (bactofilin family)